MNKEQKRLGNKGFSLVELIVVIAIMAILVAVLAPTLLSKIEESREGTDYSAMGELKTAVYESILGSETISEEIDGLLKTAKPVVITVKLDSTKDYEIKAFDKAPTLQKAVVKVIPNLDFKSDAAQDNTLKIEIDENYKVTVKIVDSKGAVVTKKNEEKFEVK